MVYAPAGARDREAAVENVLRSDPLFRDFYDTLALTIGIATKDESGHIVMAL